MAAMKWIERFLFRPRAIGPVRIGLAGLYLHVAAPAALVAAPFLPPPGREMLLGTAAFALGVLIRDYRPGRDWEDSDDATE